MEFIKLIDEPKCPKPTVINGTATSAYKDDDYTFCNDDDNMCQVGQVVEVTCEGDDVTSNYHVCRLGQEEKSSDWFPALTCGKWLVMKCIY